MWSAQSYAALPRLECTSPEVFPRAGFPYTIRHGPCSLVGGGAGPGLAATAVEAALALEEAER